MTAVWIGVLLLVLVGHPFLAIFLAIVGIMLE